ncbi:MAG TPA: HEAT repeat domain-containing protein, partial [Gammaproteobacteria bacterium]|nr:HEAT repeat domain-containing protein [Gammaproteobacteria bacterium]
PYSIVVLAASDPAADARAAAIFADCHTGVVREPRAIVGLSVIAGDRVASYAGTNLTPEEIARQLGAGSVLVLGTAPQAMVDQAIAVRAGLGLTSRYGSCRAQQLDAQSGVERSNAMQLHPEWNADTTRAFAANVAEKVREAVLENPATLIAAARATVLDTALGARERMTALSELRRGAAFTEPLSPSGPDGATFRAAIPVIGLRALLEPIPGAYDDAVVATVAQIGLTSDDARARQAAWNGLRGVRDPQAVQALVTSLANDTDENVRRAAALALGYLVDEPGVRDALTRAAAQDPSETPPVPCCIPSVRDAARRALLSDAELRESALRTVLDETLPSEERVRPLYQSLDGRAFPVELSDEAAQAVFDIGSGAEDPLTRARAWDALAAFRNPDFVPTLLADLAGHSAENVRASAASALHPYVDDPAVRAALEQAQDDPLNSVRRAAQAALDAREDAEHTQE